MIAIIPKPNSPLITTTPFLYNNPNSSFPVSFLTCSSFHQRRRFRSLAASLVLPLLPFPTDQVLVPSEAKTLHLYEARYLALLEESLFQKNKLFVHFVLDPLGFAGTSSEASFGARFGCLVTIEKVEQLNIGALVSIRGVGRVKLLKFKQNLIMVRSKVKYELIADERVRHETFKKRKAGFFKKLLELKTLCGVDACAIVINQDGTQSDIWPSPLEASEVIQRFQSLPFVSQTSNMVDQVGFLNQNISRLTHNLEKETSQVRSLEKDLCLAEWLNKGVVDVTNSNELYDMLRVVKRKIQMVDRQIDDIENPTFTTAKGGPCSSTMAIDRSCSSTMGTNQPSSDTMTRDFFPNSTMARGVKESEKEPCGKGKQPMTINFLSMARGENESEPREEGKESMTIDFLSVDHPSSSSSTIPCSSSSTMGIDRTSSSTMTRDFLYGSIVAICEKESLKDPCGKGKQPI